MTNRPTVSARLLIPAVCGTCRILTVWSDRTTTEGLERYRSIEEGRKALRAAEKAAVAS